MGDGLALLAEPFVCGLLDDGFGEGHRLGMFSRCVF